MGRPAHRAFAALDHLAAMRAWVVQRWEALPSAWRTSQRLCTAGVGLALMLLWCFYAVVDDAVERGATNIAPFALPHAQTTVDRAARHHDPA